MDRKKDSESVAGRRVLRWALTKRVQEEALNQLFHKDEADFVAPERGFLGLVHPCEGVESRTLLLREIVPQKEGWVSFTAHGLSFDPHYFSRALDVVSSSPIGAGIIIVHSHLGSSGPIRSPPEPSKADLLSERRLLFQLGRALPAAAPLASGILTRNGAWRVREYRWSRPKSAEEVASGKFGIDTAIYEDATSLRLVASDSLQVYRYGRRDMSRQKSKEVDSTIRLWGDEGQRVLGGLKVGVAGLGGVGSMLVEFLARLGVGELVMVDYDVVSQENLNRMIGARRDEIGKPKVDYAVRIANEAATAHQFRARGVRASIVEWEGLRPLLDADIIMNAADSPFARQVLDHVSYSYILPVIDGGTKLLVGALSGETIGKSQAGKAGPGDPCLECCGVYTQEEATLARESVFMQGASRYVQVGGQSAAVDLPRAPSVINFNSLVASLMVQRLMSVVLGFPPRQKRGQQRYYVELGSLEWGPIQDCKDGCPKSSWVGLGESHPVPVGVDPLWKQMRQESPRIGRKRK